MSATVCGRVFVAVRVSVCVCRLKVVTMSVGGSVVGE